MADDRRRTAIDDEIVEVLELAEFYEDFFADEEWMLIDSVILEAIQTTRSIILERLKTDDREFFFALLWFEWAGRMHGYDEQERNQERRASDEGRRLQALSRQSVKLRKFEEYKDATRAAAIRIRKPGSEGEFTLREIADDTGFSYDAVKKMGKRDIQNGAMMLLHLYQVTRNEDLFRFRAKSAGKNRK